MYPDRPVGQANAIVKFIPPIRDYELGNRFVQEGQDPKHNVIVKGGSLNGRRFNNTLKGMMVNEELHSTLAKSRSEGGPPQKCSSAGSM
jgi:hypothetical protein